IKELQNSKKWAGMVSLLFEKRTPITQTDSFAEQLMKDPSTQENVVAFESPYRFLREFASNHDLPKEDVDVSPLYEKFVDKNYVPRILIYVKDTSSAAMQVLKARASEICRGQCHLGGEVVAYSDFASSIPKTLINSMLISLALVAATLVYLAL